MKRAVLLLIIVLGASVAGARADESDEATRAHKRAIDVAAAFANDGFKMRDGHWAGLMQPQERTLVAVNLYAGNQYWFSVGATDGAKKLAVELYDENGHAIAADDYNEGNKAAAGFSPANSGQYFVSLAIVDDGPATCCLIYSYT